MKSMIWVMIAFSIVSTSILAQIDYSSQVQPIFDSNCIACHGGTSGVTVTDYASVMGSIGVQYGGPIVIPTDTANSPLWDKINPNPQYGSRMPFGGTLSSENINTIGQWILEGALPLTDVDANSVLPAGFRLLSCYPNPFNSSTTLRIVNQTFAQIRLAVYDVHGRVVHKFTGEYDAGYHDIPIHFSNWPSGIYVILMQAITGNRLLTSQTQKVILMK